MTHRTCRLGMIVVLALLVGWAGLGLERLRAEPNAKASKTPLMMPFADLKWTPLPEKPGMQFATVTGDPKTGAYTQLRKVPGGTDNALHSHSSELTNVIISGVWYTGADKASAKDLGPGSVVTMPANWVHVSGCRSGSDCLFYQQGDGKFDFNPAAATTP